MILDFKDVTRELNEYYVKGGKTIKKYEFYPHKNSAYLITGSYEFIPLYKLDYIRSNGSDVGIYLRRGLVEIKYGKDKSKSIFKHFMGTFEGELDGKKTIGILTKDNVSEDAKNTIENKKLLKIKKHLNILDRMGLIKDPEYLASFC